MPYDARIDRLPVYALLENGHSRHGETVHVRLNDGVIPALVTPPIHYDSDGERLRS